MCTCIMISIDYSEPHDFSSFRILFIHPVQKFHGQGFIFYSPVECVSSSLGHYFMTIKDGLSDPIRSLSDSGVI